MVPKRGLLDFVLTCVTCAAVYSQTPVGALLDRGLEAVLGIERPHRDLTAFFEFDRGEGPTDEDLARLARLRTDRDLATERRAARLGTEPELYRALTLALEEDRSTVDVIAQAVTEKAERHGHLDAAIEAYFLGDEAVERAIDEARRRGIDAPWRMANHRSFLTRRQRERSAPVVNRVMSIHTALTFRWPVTRPHRITSPFGPRGDPFLGTERFHNGVDLGVPVGTEVLAAQDGIVEHAAYDGVNGYYVQLSHGYGLRTAYCHNSKLLLRTGARAARGQTIALSGSTGRSTGPHLHYVVRIGRKAIDPERFRPTGSRSGY